MGASILADLNESGGSFNHFAMIMHKHLLAQIWLEVGFYRTRQLIFLVLQDNITQPWIFLILFYSFLFLLLQDINGGEVFVFGDQHFLLLAKEEYFIFLLIRLLKISIVYWNVFKLVLTLNAASRTTSVAAPYTWSFTVCYTIDFTIESTRTDSSWSFWIEFTQKRIEVFGKYGPLVFH